MNEIDFTPFVGHQVFINDNEVQIVGILVYAESYPLDNSYYLCRMRLSIYNIKNVMICNESVAMLLSKDTIQIRLLTTLEQRCYKIFCKKNPITYFHVSSHTACKYLFYFPMSFYANISSKGVEI